jgi:hypothetical protein
MVMMMLGDITENCVSIGHPCDDVDIDDLERYNIGFDTIVNTSLKYADAERFRKTGKTEKGRFTIITRIGKVTVYTESD